jgi:NAD(P) transhydrogenase subunit alpha
VIVAVLKETHPGERRVSLVPSALAGLAKAGIEVVIESGAGAGAGFPDALFAEKGARIASSRPEAVAEADVLVQVRPLGAALDGGSDTLDGVRRGQAVVGFLDPLIAPAGVHALGQRGLTAFALELIPRTTRAQAMDVLSSAATVVGYKAVLLAANALPQMFPLMMTAGGTLAPARVFVIGAGVAGLQAIATARKLGAVVQAYDVRPAVKEQVESLGAKFVELPIEVADSQDAGGYARAMDESFYRRQRETMARVVAASDVVITTAAVPGKKAPVLITGEMLDAMPPGAVVVDVAAEQGGNCEVTRAGATVLRGTVTVLGPVNLPSSVPHHASQMHGKNVANFLALLAKDGAFRIDLDDDIVRETLVVREGEIVHPRVREALGLPEPASSVSR